MPRAIQITAYGGPEQLNLVDLPLPNGGEPGPVCAPAGRRIPWRLAQNAIRAVL